MTDLVTGEAVVLELRLARFASRALAVAMDAVVQISAMVVVALALAGTTEVVDSALAAAIGLVTVVGATVGYPVAIETLTQGRSVGRMALGLRVVRDDGGPIRFRHALIRGLVGFFELWATSGILALGSSLASAKGKRLGDHLAGTVVVRERVPVAQRPAVEMPAELAGWAAGLDLSALPAELALTVRQYLARRHELAPAAGEALASELAGAVSAVVSPPPPPGTAPTAYLAAVLAERRHREAARLGVTDQHRAAQAGPVTPELERPDPPARTTGGPEQRVGPDESAGPADAGDAAFAPPG